MIASNNLNELMVYKSGGKNHDYLITLKLSLNDGRTKTNLSRTSEFFDKNYAKFRTNRAYVVDIVNKKTNEKVTTIESNFTSSFKYKVGEMIEEKSYDTYNNSVCSSGIHFFLSQERAYFYDGYHLENGVFKHWGDDGKLCEISHYKNNKLDGLLTEFYASTGNKMRENNYIDGKLNGLCRNWFEDGTLNIEAFYKDDKLHGIHKEFHKNGKLFIEKNYANNMHDGLFREFDDGQLLYEKNFINNELDGVYKKWHDNTQLYIESNYKCNKLNGLFREWDKNGKLNYETIYEFGNINEYVKNWYENGQLCSDVNYKNNVKHGMTKQYYDDGTLFKEIEYKNGHMDGYYKTWYKYIDEDSITNTIMTSDDKQLVSKLDKDHMTYIECKYMDGDQCEQAKQNLYKNGVLISEIIYPYQDISKKDSRELDKDIIGEYNEFYESGKLMSHKITKNNKLYSYQTFYENGEIKSKQSINNSGMIHDEEWYENGNKKCDKTYGVNGIDGTYKEWYQNGNLMWLMHYKQNKLHGMCKRYDASGRITNDSYYQNDKKMRLYKVRRLFWNFNNVTPRTVTVN